MHILQSDSQPQSISSTRFSFSIFESPAFCTADPLLPIPCTDTFRLRRSRSLAAEAGFGLTVGLLVDTMVTSDECEYFGAVKLGDGEEQGSVGEVGYS